MDDSPDVRSSAFRALQRIDIVPHASTLLKYALKFPDDPEADLALQLVCACGNDLSRKRALNVLVGFHASEEDMDEALALRDAPSRELPGRLRTFLLEKDPCGHFPILFLGPPRDDERHIAWRVASLLVADEGEIEEEFRDERIRIRELAALSGAREIVDVMLSNGFPGIGMVDVEFRLDCSIDFGWRWIFKSDKITPVLAALNSADTSSAPLEDTDDPAWNKVIAAYDPLLRKHDEATLAIARLLSDWQEYFPADKNILLALLLSLHLGKKHRTITRKHMATPPRALDDALRFTARVPMIDAALDEYLARFTPDETLAARWIARCGPTRNDRPLNAWRIPWLLARAGISSSMASLIDHRFSDDGLHDKKLGQALSDLERRSPGCVVNGLEPRLLENPSDVFYLFLQLDSQVAHEAVMRNWSKLLTTCDLSRITSYLERRGDPEAFQFLCDLWKPGEFELAKAAWTLWELNGRPRTPECWREIKADTKVDWDDSESVRAPFRCDSCLREFHYEIEFFALTADELPKLNDLETLEKLPTMLRPARLLKCKNCGSMEEFLWTSGTYLAAQSAMERYLEERDLRLIDEKEEDEADDMGNVDDEDDDDDYGDVEESIDASPLSKTARYMEIPGDDRTVDGGEIGRNAPCPCGSGKKYKKCCLPKKERPSRVRAEPRSLWKSALNIASAKSVIKNAHAYEVSRCLVNPDWQNRGMATILVIRRQPDGMYCFGSYLVDINCLGLKSAFSNANFSHEEVEKQIVKRFFPAGDHQTIGLYTAREIIEGAIEYASALGFDPDPDFNLARHILGDDEFQRSNRVRFGGPEGKPLFIAGPDDDAMKIIGKLQRRLGEDGFHFIAPM